MSLNGKDDQILFKNIVVSDLQVLGSDLFTKGYVQESGVKYIVFNIKGQYKALNENTAQEFENLQDAQENNMKVYEILEATKGILVSGNKEDKIEKSGVHVTPSKYVDAPIIEEYPLTLECTVESFEDGNLIGNVENVSIDEDYLDENGKIDVDKMEIIAFDGQ